MTEEKDTHAIPKWELIKDIYNNYLHIRKNFWWLFLLLLINTAFLLAEPYFYKLFIDNIQEFSTDKISYETIKSNFIYLAIIWGIISVILILAQWWYEYYTDRIMHLDWAKYAVKIWKSFLLLPYNDFVNTNPWTQQNIFNKGTDAFWSFWHNFLNKILPQILIFISLFSFWLYINWKMTLVSLVFMPISIYATLKIWGKVFNIQKEAYSAWNRSYQRLNDALNNIGIIKLFAKEKQENETLESYFSKSMKIQTSSNYLWNILNTILKWVQAFSKISVMIFWVFFVVKWFLTIGELLVFIYISWRISWPIDSLLSSYQSVIRDLADFHKTKQITDSPKELNEWKIEFSWLKNNIVLKDITFNYKKSDREILKNLNLEIKKWQKVAFVWHTWSWKTTISNLVTRFYETEFWEVIVDWINIKDYTLDSYRGKFAAVFQDTTVFNETILSNLKYIKEDATLEEVRMACKKAEILDFIEKLEAGFETEVGEKWLKLSWWERQRLSIARAILRDPDILILDEPTSALDSKTESIIQKSLNNLMKWRTSIVIAHRLSTIKNSDIIFLLENWEVIDSWSHDSLYNKNKAYKEMVDFQKDWFLEEYDTSL
ncbi:MAG: Lipid A export ATP-binding/permease protein MsbA [uncultured bacterium (gcode 4)]|uniref:Lipid A export ATP-binding/permease protein MsbA n=1 Tax=uncultured bacterium (gcode 4) TaxID=1234023 RepID=K2FWA9_9BACT|nr:MAG: Lipid A export ATP-binding/permease protein MsbA [uncultured bacterium (gcode 4)]